MKVTARAKQHEIWQRVVAWLLVTIGILAILLMAESFAADANKSKSQQPSIPAIASIVGIRVGYSTRDELEAHLGPGKHITGGHPDGARLWQVKGTGWMIWADGFEYCERGLVVDSVTLYRDRKPERSVPYARLGTNDCAWLGEISLGMKENKVLEILKQKAVPTRKIDRGWEVEANGFNAVLNQESFQKWTAVLEFTNRAVNRISVDAR